MMFWRQLAKKALAMGNLLDRKGLLNFDLEPLLGGLETVG